MKELPNIGAREPDFRETPLGAFLSDALSYQDFQSAVQKLDRCGVDNAKLLRWLWTLVPEALRNASTESLSREASRLLGRASDIGRVKEYAEQQNRTELVEQLRKWQHETEVSAGIRRMRSKSAVRGSDSDVARMAAWAVQRYCQNHHKHFAETASILQHLYQAKKRNRTFDETQLRKLCAYNGKPLPKSLTRRIPNLAKSKNREVATIQQ